MMLYTTEIDAVEGARFKSLHLLHNIEDIGETPNGDRNIRATATTRANLETFLIENEYELTAQEIMEI